MKRESQKFLLEGLGVETNPAQLKLGQQKVLYDNYQKGTKQRFYRSESERKIYNSYLNPQHKPIQLDYDALDKTVRMNEIIMKSQLANAYDNDIVRKQRERKLEKERQINQEQNMIRNAKNQIEWDRARNRQAHEEFKRQALEVTYQKQRRKALEKHYQQLQKQVYQKRFEHHMVNHTKQNTFKDHYSHVNKTQETNQMNYINTAAKMNRDKEVDKQRLVENFIQDSQRKWKEKTEREYREAINHKKSLNEQLLSQIRQKQQKKKEELNSLRSQQYTSQMYTKKHHPINNPVDFRFNHDSKYVIRELQSGLARSGSQSIIS